MIVADVARFERLCREDAQLCEGSGESIGTYNEKRLHRIFKRYITENAQECEINVGRYVADIISNGRITEIQTGSFRPLAGKIKYYLENTELEVSVLCPIIVSKTLIRADPNTGEIKSVKRSPKRECELDAIAQMYYLAELVGQDRFSLCVAHVTAEEYRYSDIIRYRKKGRYDNDLRPMGLSALKVYRDASDYAEHIPTQLRACEFCAADFSRLTHLKSRKLYSVLNLFVKLGLLKCRSEGRKNIYSTK